METTNPINNSNTIKKTIKIKGKTPKQKSPTQKTTRKKRCPNGMRINTETGLCEPITLNPVKTSKKISRILTDVPMLVSPVSSLKTLTNIIETEPPIETIQPPIETIQPPIVTIKNTTRRKCPKGTTKNRKTGICEPSKGEKSIRNNDESRIDTVQLNINEKPINDEPPIDVDAPINIQNMKKNKIELLERKELSKNTDDYNFLYPNLNDPQFNIKITERKEFNDNKYDGKIHTNISEQADILCNSDFELAPHQIFVRNFLSFQTPYNSLLLYHGLGSGKTCSAISVAEEMRDYIMQMGISSQIIIVASPNVQSNFRVQLFDERKLKQVDGLWNIRNCVGPKFLKEINPMNMKGLTEANVSKQINRIIDTYYSFVGYVKFANDIAKECIVENEALSEKQKNNIIRSKLRKAFNNKLIIIDEVHNIRVTDDNKDKRVAEELLKLIKYVTNLRLLLLSATPMFNSYKEIVWLVNLMNMNDRRSTIEVGDVFNKDGSFKVSADGEEIGRELLERKATGYISFVRGENPYTFPYRVWPTEFAPEHTFENKRYPSLQLNGTSQLTDTIKHLSLYLVDIGEYQQKGYNYIIRRIKGGYIGNYKQMPNLENIETFGYTMMQQPLEGLNIIYPDIRLNDEKPEFNSLELVGGEGLKRIMTFVEDPSTHFRSKFSYIPATIERYGKIFSPTEIGKYSSKIDTICKHIMNSSGVILVYSQYIDAGLVPLALALEELGFLRAGDGQSLFDKPPTGKRNGFNYVMITGDKGFSSNPTNDIKLLTNENNIDGSKVKVALISQTGAEGLDLKFIRQVHILEPWYNMNRIEQIIGRAVRTCSHKSLPFSQRNVEIYLYGSLMRDDVVEETADLYIYRLAEAKAIQIGKVSRVLKEMSVDCILNRGQNNFIDMKDAEMSNNSENDVVKPVKLELSSGVTIENYEIGDKPFSAICDYMESCSYVCRPNKEITDDNVNLDTYNENFIMMNNDKLIYKIKQLMKERFFYKKKDMIILLNLTKKYPLVQINAALHQLVEDKTEYVIDKYGRVGHLINISDLYLFQPLEINDDHTSIYEKSIPLNMKHDRIVVNLPKEIKVNEAVIRINNKKDDKLLDSDKLYKKIEEMYKLAIEEQLIIKGEENWYMFCYPAIDFLIKNGYEVNTLHYLIAEHIIDELKLSDIIIILRQFQKNPIFDKTEVFKFIKMYMTAQLLKAKNNLTGFLWKDKGKQVLFVKQNKNEGDIGEDNREDNREDIVNYDEIWSLAEAEDMKDFQENLNNRSTNIISNLNSIIGFMNNFKTEDFVVFKTKDINKSRDTGARCDQNSNKGKAIDILNSIVGKNNFTYPPNKKISQKELCIIQELYLRLFDKERKNKKRWFLSPTDAVLTNIEKYSTVDKKGKK